jgi:hypothetical protein
MSGIIWECGGSGVEGIVVSSVGAPVEGHPQYEGGEEEGGYAEGGTETA